VGRRSVRQSAHRETNQIFLLDRLLDVPLVPRDGARVVPRADVASVLNAFVPIKVDREEQPDVDRVYMTFVQATTDRAAGR
jgi:hypothetical protein